MSSTNGKAEEVIGCTLGVLAAVGAFTVSVLGVIQGGTTAHAVCVGASIMFGLNLLRLALRGAKR